MMIRDRILENKKFTKLIKKHLKKTRGKIKIYTMMDREWLRKVREGRIFWEDYCIGENRNTARWVFTIACKEYLTSDFEYNDRKYAYINEMPGTHADIMSDGIFWNQSLELAYYTEEEERKLIIQALDKMGVFGDVYLDDKYICQANGFNSQNFHIYNHNTLSRRNGRDYWERVKKNEEQYQLEERKKYEQNKKEIPKK